MKTAVNYGIDWENINLESGYERDQSILDKYNFDTLLLELQHNVRELNEQTVRAEFNAQLKSKIESAKEIFEANLSNITKQAIKERNQY